MVHDSPPREVAVRRQPPPLPVGVVDATPSQYTIILRGESTRKAELADLYNVFLSDEGSEYLEFILRTSAGKTIPLALEGNLRI
jgi:hypothetical protein